jgi:hypothetical protein
MRLSQNWLRKPTAQNTLSGGNTVAKITCMGPEIMAAMEHFFLRANVVPADWFLDSPLAFPSHRMQILYHSARLPQTPHLWKA